MDFYRPPTAQGTLDALGSLYRAIRAWRFYPKGHPTRRSSLSLAHSALLQLLDGNMLSLACGRSGFSFPDGEVLKDSSGLSAALAFELFVRRVQKLSLSPDLFQEDLLELCKIMCLSPEVIQQSDGIDALMASRGIRSIWVNEFDLAAIRSKRQKVEQSGIKPLGIDEAEAVGETSPAPEKQLPETVKLPPAEQLQGILGRLAVCVNDDTYLILVRQAVACTESLQLRGEPRQQFPLIELLAGHSGDETRSQQMRECARFALEQIITTGDILTFVLNQIESESSLSKSALLAVIQAGGTTAITLTIELMGRTGSIKTRKTLATLLESLGEAAVPALLGLMNDPRWFIIRNICAILGAIASSDALDALTKCLHHTDLRVRKEAIRSMAQLGGREAETAILAILRSSDTALHPQAIASLGGMKSKRALADLMKILFTRDMFLKSLQLKIDVLAAVASIGERQVTPHLVTLLDERHLLAAVRGRQLKTAVISCLGKLGDAAAVPALKKLLASGRDFGPACADALALIERTEGKNDGNY